MNKTSSDNLREFLSACDGLFSSYAKSRNEQPYGWQTYTLYRHAIIVASTPGGCEFLPYVVEGTGRKTTVTLPFTAGKAVGRVVFTYQGTTTKYD